MNNKENLTEKLYIQANLCALQQSYRKAIDIYSEVLAIDDTFIDALLSRALAYEALDDKTDAINDYKKAVSLLQRKLIDLNTPAVSDAKKQHDLKMCTEHEKKLYKYIARYKKTSSAQASKILNLQKSRTTDVINDLIKKGFILKQGQGRATYYTIDD